ncbi:TPR-like protein [Infundibulicybe gibba]|nr:TPR-like protein [Infundibulicybe gibba]
MSLSSALSTLATYRTNNTRASQQTFSAGVRVLKAGSSHNLGDEGWAFLEQLALASIDVGRLDIADQCLKQLTDKFPDSPRVDVLTGIRIEASETPTTALQYYNKLLEADSANMAVWKRRISIIRRMGRTDKAIDELVQFLDIFYTDVEGWLELADLYSSCNQYTPALQALSHALLLAPQNPFTFLQFAETAYTAGDLPLALKMALVVLDMCNDTPSPTDPARGISLRAWYSVKLCTCRLIASPSSPSASGTPAPPSAKVALLDELATEQILRAYSLQDATENVRQGVQLARSLAQKWVGGRS